MRERERYSLADRLALGRRTLVVGVRRDFAAPVIFFPIFFLAYALGVPLVVDTIVASLAAALCSGRLGRWLISRIRLRRARSGPDEDLRSMPAECQPGDS